ncbi:MAG: sugar transferase [Candidatus Schekmanbacteria bacterium]|nr:sugar transferase [Candidatus Schekmanbacteria bacterium]
MNGLYSKYFKRALDIIFILVILSLMLIPMLIIALLIKLDSKGTVFFSQERVGKDGKLFDLYKFRTMLPNAAKMGAGILVEKNDPRVTRIGQWLRVSGLDELPQGINILRGDMSIIGPRPTLKYQVDQYTPHQRQRLLIRPGISGLAQVSGRKSIDWDKRIEYDIEYIRHLSFLLDCKILLLTFPALISREEDLAKADYWKK